jgi:hypothetical protein
MWLKKELCGSYCPKLRLLSGICVCRVQYSFLLPHTKVSVDVIQKVYAVFGGGFYNP